MAKRGPVLLAAAVTMAAIIAARVLTERPPAPALLAPRTFAFGALGDAPYDVLETLQYPQLLRDMNAHDLAFSIHVGDIFWRPCSDDRYSRSLEWFNTLNAPLIYVPGDNEWADCWTRQEGGFDPRNRLDRLRQAFYQQPTSSLGRRRVSLETQSTEPSFAEFVEHARWLHAGLVFVTLHVVGSGNFTEPFPARTEADDVEAQRRTTAATRWLVAAFAHARAESARGVVVALHADPGFNEPPEEQRPFKPLLDTLADEASRFEHPVLLIHGDSHQFKVDQPLRVGGSGRAISNVTRLIVPGSPRVGWVRIVVPTAGYARFDFEPRVVPSWKYW